MHAARSCETKSTTSFHGREACTYLRRVPCQESHSQRQWLAENAIDDHRRVLASDPSSARFGHRQSIHTISAPGAELMLQLAPLP